MKKKRNGLFLGTRIILMAFLVCGGLFSSEASPEAAEPLDRSLGPLILGMSVDALQKVVQVDEKKETYLELAEGERFFVVRPVSLPPDVQNMDCKTFHGKLYKITVLYTPDFVAKTPWDILFSRYSDRYGKVPVKQEPLGERKMLDILRWEDPQTIFILKRERTAPSSRTKSSPPPPVLIAIYLDQPLWQERFQLEMNQIPFF